MDHVAIEDLYGCIDREAMEIAERAVLPEGVFDAVAVQVLVSAAADGYTVDTVVTCEPGNPWCRRKHLVADADGAVLHLTEPVAIGDCPSAHQLALEQVRRWWEDIYAGDGDGDGDGSRSPWVPSLGPSTSLGLWQSPAWRWSVDAWVQRRAEGAQPGLAMRVTAGLPQSYEVMVSPMCWPEACVGNRTVTLLAVQAGGVLGADLGPSPVRVDAGAWFGPASLWGGAYPTNRQAWAPWLDLEAAIGLDFGVRGTWSLGLQGEPLAPTLETDVGPDARPFSWGRIALGLRLPLTGGGPEPTAG